MSYIPDRWVVIEISTPEETIKKVLATWYGDFTNGERWRVSSGITEVEDNDDHYLFHNHSGSTYQCSKKSQGMGSYTSTIYESWLKEIPEGVSITILEEYN